MLLRPRSNPTTPPAVGYQPCLATTKAGAFEWVSRHRQGLEEALTACEKELAQVAAVKDTARNWQRLVACNRLRKYPR
jgi:hypothetical protein